MDTPSSNSAPLSSASSAHTSVKTTTQASAQISGPISAHEFSWRNQRVSWYRSGAGSDLLLLHGWGSSASPFFPLAGSLGDLRRCSMIDFPGFGQSEELKTPWSLSDYADLVVSWLDEMEVKQFDILVHSFGNRVLLNLLQRPEIASRIQKIIVTGGAGLKPRRSLQTRSKLAFVKLLKFPASLMPGTLSEWYLSRLRSTDLWKRMGSSDYAKLSGAMRQTFTQVVNTHFDADLGQISREMLLLWGENDTATPLEQGRRLEKAMKGSALIELKGAGHYAFLDKPNEFSAIVRSYLSETEKTENG